MKTKFNGILTLLLAFVVQLTFAQEKTISGTVVDETNMPLPGATVLIKGTTTGASTDFDGKYSISANTGDVLTFSYVGYADQNITVGASNTIDVSLALDGALEEVVVVAYGKQKEENISSAIETVKAEKIAQIPNASLDQLLQGQAAGLNIQTNSGQPGASGTVILRGRNSLNGVVEPLYVLDGVPVDEDNFRSLNSNDIASVSVLKDASASAIYGNRGAGGVIIVTTKKGTKGSGTQFTYRGLSGIALNNDPGFDVLNSRQLLTLQQNLGVGEGAGLTDAQIDALATQTNTNWEDVLFRNGRTTSHELNIRTGSDKTTSYNSIGYFEQEGTTLRSDLQRFTFRSNIQTKANDKLTFRSNLTANFSKTNLVAASGGSLDNPFLTPYLASPTIPYLNPDGSLNIVGTDYTTVNGTQLEGFLNTPFLALNSARLNSELEEEIRIVGNIGGDYNVVKNITIGSDVGLDFIHETFKNIVDPASLRGTTTPTADALVKGSLFEGIERDAKFNINAYLKYEKSFNDLHNLEVSAFTEFFKRHFNQFGYTGYGVDPKLIGSGSGLTDGQTTEGDDDALYYVPEVYSTSFEDALFSYFGVLRYNYDDKYNFQGSLRRDASARFSDTNKWGTFWSVSGAWNIHKEDFLAGNKTINELKLRASYGTVGNSSTGIGLFQSGTLIGNGIGYNGTTGYFTGTIGNPDLKWETTSQANLGLDLALFNYKLDATIDVYEKITDDLFINQPLSSAASGTTSIDSNLAKMSNKGIELSLNYKIIENDNFMWSVNGNVAYNKNEILDLGPDYNGDPIAAGGGTVFAEGEAAGTYFLTRWAGVSSQNGLPLYLDVNGNLTQNYSLADRVLTDKTRDPKYTGGFGTTVKYKNLSFNTLFAFAAEQYRINSALALIEDNSFANIFNQSTDVLDAWEQTGDVTNMPLNNGSSFRSVAGDRYLEDASFLRLRNISLSYQFNNKVVEKSKIFKGARVYMQAQNLLTWSKWRGFDPESNDTTSFFRYPTPRTFSVGLDLNF